MKVSIKDLAVSMEIKNKGMELEVYDNDETFLGDLVVTKTKLVWCPGKTTPENGHPIKWSDFITYMKTLPKSK
jgi:hypothetical protein